jgi:signal transduction histidine kinase
MGLGLAMVKNIMETYNGNITFETEVGKGTIFRVDFPKNV